MTHYATFSPVKLFLRAPELRTVSSVRDAVAVLLEEWPPDAARGVAHLAALEECKHYLQGNSTAANVRLALIAAASEAGILVQRSSRH